MTLLGFKTILHKKCRFGKKSEGSSRKFLGAVPMSSKMKTNFKKSAMLPVLWIVFVLFSSSCVPYVASFSGLFSFCFSSSCVPYVVSFPGLFLFCFLRLVYPMLPVLWIVFVLFSSSCVPYVASSLDCPFLIFSNVF